jgi:hypothetical protein
VKTLHSDHEGGRHELACQPKESVPGDARCDRWTYPHRAGGLRVDQKLVPTCAGQALFGAFINHYPGVTGWENQMNAGVERYGRDIPVWHDYHSYERPHNAIPLDPATVDGAAERRFATSGKIVWPIWKPVGDWSAAVASTNPNDPEDRLIRQAADNIKSLAPHKVFFSIHGEPENEVSGGGHCTQYKGKTPGNTPGELPCHVV